MYSEPKRVEYLDSIRGLAALFVLLCHTVSAFVWPASYGFIMNLPFIHILVDGKEAVAMFFVLSGYVLSKPYLSARPPNQPRTIYLPTFYLRRFTRIWIPWFAFFLASIVARTYLFSSPVIQPAKTSWLASFWQAPMSWHDFFLQCLFLLHDASRQLLVQDWSLGMELKGSVLVSIAVILLKRKHSLLTLGLFLLILVFIGTGYYYASFCIGIMIANYEGACQARLQRTNGTMKLIGLVLALLFYQCHTYEIECFGFEPALLKIGWVITSLGCGGILLFIMTNEPAKKILSSRPFVFLGRISYSVYLVQFIIIMCLLPPLIHWLNLLGISSPLVIFCLVVVASVSVCVLISAFTYRFIEVPAINLGHRLTKKIQ